MILIFIHVVFQVDEADIDLVGSPGSNRNNKRANPISDALTRIIPSKRKPGPLPRDLLIRKPSLDSTPPQSPSPSNAPSPFHGNNNKHYNKYCVII